MVNAEMYVDFAKSRASDKKTKLGLAHELDDPVNLTLNVRILNG